MIEVTIPPSTFEAERLAPTIPMNEECQGKHQIAQTHETEYREARRQRLHMADRLADEQTKQSLGLDHAVEETNAEVIRLEKLEAEYRVRGEATARVLTPFVSERVHDAEKLCNEIGNDILESLYANGRNIPLLLEEAAAVLSQLARIVGTENVVNCLSEVTGYGPVLRRMIEQHEDPKVRAAHAIAGFGFADVKPKDTVDYNTIGLAFLQHIAAKAEGN